MPPQPGGGAWRTGPRSGIQNAGPEGTCVNTLAHGPRVCWFVRVTPALRWPRGTASCPGWEGPSRTSGECSGWQENAEQQQHWWLLAEWPGVDAGRWGCSGSSLLCLLCPWLEPPSGELRCTCPLPSEGSGRGPRCSAAVLAPFLALEAGCLLGLGLAAPRRGWPYEAGLSEWGAACWRHPPLDRAHGPRHLSQVPLC